MPNLKCWVMIEVDVCMSNYIPQENVEIDRWSGLFH